MLELLQLVTPLQKQKDGGPYTRPPEIEQTLASLYNLPIEEVARRASIDDPADPEYVPSECILHFVRKSKANGDSAPYRDLFEVLRKRVLRAVPVLNRRVRGLSKPGVQLSQADIQDFVLDKFQELLCLDRKQYEERLDYYEVRFNSALAALRVTSQRSVSRRESHLEPMQYEDDTLDVSAQVEEAFSRLKATNSTSEEDSRYRFRLLAAISSLPEAEKQVIELILQGIALVDIAKLLNCAEKTVYNRRERAYAAIRASMQEEDNI